MLRDVVGCAQSGYRRSRRLFFAVGWTERTFSLMMFPVNCQMPLSDLTVMVTGLN